jgi:hypothetical protein
MGFIASRGAAASALIIFLFSFIVPSSDAHAPGEEYTYLNMFRKKDSSDSHFSTDEFANAKPGPANVSPGRTNSKRRLHSLRRSRVRMEVEAVPDVEKEKGDVPKAHWRKLSSRSDSAQRDKRKRDTGKQQEAEANGLEPNNKSREKAVTKSVSEDASEDDDNSGSAESPSGPSVKASKEAGNDKAASEPFDGVGGKKDGEDIKRVSFMLLRLLRQYKATSMVDVPCRAHASWMHKFLVRLEQEIPDFKYFCVDSSKEILQAVKSRVNGKAHAKFILRLFWEEKLPRADFVFSWSGLDKMKHENVVKMLRNVATSNRHKYIILGSHQKGSKILAKKATELNVRSKPFSLAKPMRVISKLSEEPVRKQMYIYKTDEMRDWDEKK